MILLYNVCVTPENSSCNIVYDRGLLPNFDKIEILKYSLSSLSVIPWSEAILNIELKNYYKIFESDIEKYVEENFKNIKFTFSKTRACLQKDWQNLIKKIMCIKDTNIFYCGNHDHIFMAPNLNVLEEIENKLNVSPLSTYIIYSHLAEFHTDNFDEKFSLIHCKNVHAMCCMKKESFDYFWTSFDFGRIFIPRTDWYFRDSIKNNFVNTINWSVFTPHTACSEHFDGYSHRLPVDIFQPLIIPPGFFNNDIKIQFGGKRKNNFFYINCFEKLAIFDVEGTDAMWGLEDIPLFWKSKISTIFIDKDYDIISADIIKKSKYLQYLFYFPLLNRSEELITNIRAKLGISNDIII